MATYRKAGVDLEAADRLVEQIGPLVTATWNERVVGGFGGFAGGIRLPDGYRRPVLMMSTDGVGTKLELARRAGRYDGVGFDLVAMCVDDLAATGATPVAFTDYLAVGRIDLERDRALIASVAAACSAAGCALLGGETAEHPGVLSHDDFDLAGAALGVVEDGEQVTGAGIAPGDVVIGVESPNIRSNGFSLVRAVLGDTSLDETFPGEQRSIADVILEPSVIYAPAALQAASAGRVSGFAHITGGGLAGNLVRVLPDGTKAEIEEGSWPIPEVFSTIRRLGDLGENEMRRTFNLGVGFVAVAAPENVSAVSDAFAAHGHTTWPIGRIVAGERRVSYV